MWKWLIIAFLVCVPAFGVGGACPTGTVYTDPESTTLTTLSALGITSCYYASAAGSDGATGKDEAHSWHFIPGMPNCASVCAGVTPGAGIGFILKGGDTWDFGNTGSGNYVGSAATFNSMHTGMLTGTSGSAGNPIYYGVDKTWFTGGSWSRPVMNGDNPLSATGVAACTYDQSKYAFWQVSSNFYQYLDNLEFTGGCWSGAQQSSDGWFVYIFWTQGASTPSHNVIANCYFHGWTHKTFACSAGPTGNCDGGSALMGSANQTFGAGDTLDQVVVDGSDTDEQSLIAVAWDCNRIERSIFRYTSNHTVCNNMHSSHDNIYEYPHSSGDGFSHGNAWESNREAPGQVNVFYNNIFRHLFLSGLGGEVVVWQTPETTDYEFNNLVYDVGNSGNGNFWDMVGSGGGGINGWTANIFNNTWVAPASGAIIANPASTTVNWLNNHCIIPSGSTSSTCYAGGGGTLSYGSPDKNIVMTPATATTDGYTSSETYVYSPPTIGSPTVGVAASQASLCSALSGSGDAWLQQAGTACSSDTAYSCTYDAVAHTMTCPARTAVARGSSWDVGAYEFSTGFCCVLSGVTFSGGSIQ